MVAIGWVHRGINTRHFANYVRSVDSRTRALLRAKLVARAVQLGQSIPTNPVGESVYTGTEVPTATQIYDADTLNDRRGVTGNARAIFDFVDSVVADSDDTLDESASEARIVQIVRMIATIDYYS